MVDTLVLGTSVARRGSSSLPWGTTYKYHTYSRNPMSDFAYTKKLIMDNKNADTRAAHEAQAEVYFDWHFEQIEAGLADTAMAFVPYEWVSDTICEIIVTDQVQAESFFAMATALGEKIGFPVSGTIVDYTE